MDAPRQLYNRERDAMSGVRALADQAFSRAAGAPLIEGNTIRLLNDARENYPAWLDAISAAKRCVHFENYIIRDDEAGRMFAEALVAKAQAGVRVRVMYDWLGGRNTSRAFWNRLRASGVDVRCYNPPRWDSPLGWLSRNHRKTITVDGQVGFVTGLCVGRMWVGVPEKNIDPWRDTGVEVRGPAVADIERTFADVWAMIGEPIPERELFTRGVHEPEGETVLRVVATVPATAGMFRVDQLVAALAKHRLWLVDAYYAGTPAYVQALCAAAGDGVDVRLLVPNATDIPLLKPLSRAGYRPLLEAGMRVFEWNGTMLHAKTAVADGRWARVGSTNLNIASWFGNCEIEGTRRSAAQVEREPVEAYRQSVDEVLPALGPDAQRGLSMGESRARLEKYGKNELTAEKPIPAWKRFPAQFQGVLVILLLIATVISTGLWLCEASTAFRNPGDFLRPLGSGDVLFVDPALQFASSSSQVSYVHSSTREGCVITDCRGSPT